MRKLGKRGLIRENVVFIILNVAFLVVMFFVVARYSNSSIFYEEMYAKQIVLAIDAAKPGTEIVFNVYFLEQLAKKNKYEGKIFDINQETNKVTVRIKQGKGYSFSYFTDNQFIWIYDKENKVLDLKIE